MTLRRKTPLKRTALKRKPPKRKLGRFKRPLRNATPKRAKRNREVKDFRQALKEEIGHCEICKQPRTLLDCHEIARGPARVRALDARYAILVLCRDCHNEVGLSPATWTVARQLSVLKKSLPEDFDVAAINELLTRRISEEDVA